ncbi:MAG: alpha/beta hydrolase [Deltaproteobacteria bacterium]|nr:alpha/beta hydrolase [Deltaproteobacteria bacterium]
MIAPLAPRSRRLALPTGLTYRVLEWGADQLDTIVLVHGFLDLGYGWEEVAAKLADRYRVIAPDLRGHGDSDWIGAGGYYHFFDYVADLDAVIARTARGRLTMVGHSMGGNVVSYWCGMRAARVHAAVLVEGLGPPEAHVSLPERTAQWVHGWAQARLRVPRLMSGPGEAVGRLRANDPHLTDERAHRLVEVGTVAVPGGLTWKHDPLHLTAGPYLYRRDVAAQFWAKIHAPVLVVDGAESRLRIPDAEATARMASFKDARRVMVAGAGHAVQRHDPEKLAALIAAHAG